MKIKHNKKRNTALVYEALVRELTKSVIKEDLTRKSDVTKILKESFSRNSELKKELDIYQTLDNLRGLDQSIIERVIVEAKIQHSKLNKDKVFQEQTSLINKINKSLGLGVYDNFVPNYKNLATIYSIFSDSTPIKSKVLLERKLTDLALNGSPGEQKETKQPIDNLVYKSFVKSFNAKYFNKLNESQKALMTRFVTSFADEGLELKMFLNEEVSSLKSTFANYIDQLPDAQGKQKFSEVVSILEGMKRQEVSVGMVESVLKIQQLKEEIEKDGS
jgi:hypothetical protein